MDEQAARSAFAAAVETNRHEFGSFFLSRFFGVDFSYGDDTCKVTFPVNDYMYNPQGTLHGGVISFALDISIYSPHTSVTNNS